MGIADIVKKSSSDDIIDQMIEECGELIQACVKLKRAYRGTTPVSIMDARVALVEEMADVEVARTVMMYGILSHEERREMAQIESDKTDRWCKRINEAGGA